ncbi:MAG: tetratricopeptide repeat protein [Wenzhouxiangellaceae bacterium]
MSTRPAALRRRLLYLLAELQRRHVFRVAVVYALTAFAALQTAQLLAEGLDLPAWVFRAITLVTVLGFPVALVLAWALELTPARIRQTRSLEPGAVTLASSVTPRRWWPVALGTLALLMFAGGVWMAMRQPLVQYDSIAVLPFVDLSAEGGRGYLGDGLADELINALGNVTALKVAARTSAFSFRARDVDVREIGRSLGVATVLEGSVRPAGEQIRIVLQLVDANTGFRIWGGEYESGTDGLYILQNRIAGEIVEMLAVEFGAVDPNRLRRSGTLNRQAYHLYLSARQKWAGRQVPELWLALEEMREAVALDTEFALAWAGLADVIQALARRDPNARHLRAEARAAAVRAVTIAPDLAEAWASLGAVAGESRVDWETAERALSRAVAMRPSYAQAHQWLGDARRYLGQFDRATTSYERAVALDPLSAVFRRILAAHLARFGDAGRALALLRQLLAESPDDHETLARLALTKQLPLTPTERGDYAVAWAHAIGFSDPDGAAAMVRAFDEPQFLARALAVVERIEAEIGPLPVLSEFCAALGAPEQTLALLERGIEALDPELFGVGADPLYAFLAEEPRFTELARRQQAQTPETVGRAN